MIFNLCSFGGFKNILTQSVKVYRQGGFLGLYLKIKKKLRTEPVVLNLKSLDKIRPVVRPYYISFDQKKDENKTTETASVLQKKIAIHLHLYYQDMLDEFISRLKNIPYAFDLFVSVSDLANKTEIQNKFKIEVSNLNQIVIEAVPNQGRDMAPLIIQFGKRLCDYDLIGHVHTKKSLHNKKLNQWFHNSINLLMGSSDSSGASYIANMFDLLLTQADIIVPENNPYLIKDESGWAGNFDLAKYILEKYTKISMDDFKKVDFSEGSMFWAKTECLKHFLNLPLKYSDFPKEPIAADGTLAHALERLLLIFATQNNKKCFRLIKNDSINDFKFYEHQQDFSSSIIHKNIKVLSYYLPQFHPIPENDLWHGQGFTEWTKVQSAQPLFQGHYQQHIPHEDIGYYHLNSPDVLRKQADMMKKHGVHGQIFYHYWFSGQLILEKPAQMLLNNFDIDMPFCFCWANENWTRRWDGNEKEILLAQNYSAQDAKDFIQYLIPFFKDARYIKMDNRPVLYIYRPTSIINVDEYIKIWTDECHHAGLKNPYIIAVLTRGATDPNIFKMDAGVERVLHDWTDGGAPEIKQNLKSYEPLKGSVLSYNAVADFYQKQNESKNFIYFRSLVPMWDNTARYGAEAFLLHESSPEKFQEWLEQSIQWTEKNLPSDYQYIVINAWNEWAEGAHLEPDTRHGYAYLNSIGRALSNQKYSQTFNTNCILPNNIHIDIQFSEHILNQFTQDKNLKKQFLQVLKKSTIFNLCSISSNHQEFVRDSINKKTDSILYTLELHRACVFDSSILEKMLMTSFINKCDVISNAYGLNSDFSQVNDNGSVDMSAAFGAPLILKAPVGSKVLKLRSDARSFISSQSSVADEKKQTVTTIIRYHKNGDFSELKNAIYSLFAISDCKVIPYVAAQDLSAEQKKSLQKFANDFLNNHDFKIEIEFYESIDGKTDLRSKMLNESLKKIKTKYVAFLDYDDLMLPQSYGWLLNRLKMTGKAVAFGRVYSTAYHSKNQIFLERTKKYEFGFTYKDFIYNNHAPLHSFMLDLTQMDLSQIIYYDNQKYAEDYFLTLQIFTDKNCDWASLKENHYVGDYIQSIDRDHTLAFLDHRSRRKMIMSKEYVICNERIENLHKKIVQGRV